MIFEKKKKQDDREPDEDIEILPARAEEPALPARKRSSSAALLPARESSGKRQRSSVVIPLPVVEVVELGNHCFTICLGYLKATYLGTCDLNWNTH